jgi:hypothetical protein
MMKWCFFSRTDFASKKYQVNMCLFVIAIVINLTNSQCQDFVQSTTYLNFKQTAYPKTT